MTKTHLIIPGYDNSGPKHWQTYWEKSLPNAVRVNQRDWQNPLRDEWVATLGKAIQEIEGAKILIAHSLGCNTVLEWAKDYNGDDIGALLVAPPDIEAFTDPDLVALARTWMPVSHHKFSFPAIVIASSDDPYTKLENSEKLAAKWGARFVNLGNAGHINDESGYGRWEEGKKFLECLSA